MVCTFSQSLGLCSTPSAPFNQYPSPLPNPLTVHPSPTSLGTPNQAMPLPQFSHSEPPPDHHDSQPVSTMVPTKLAQSTHPASSQTLSGPKCCAFLCHAAPVPSQSTSQHPQRRFQLATSSSLLACSGFDATLFRNYCRVPMVRAVPETCIRACGSDPLPLGL